MYVVAIAELDRSLDEETQAIAAILGTSVYDVRLALHATPPSVVLRTPSRAHAEEVVSALGARRCRTLLADLDQVVPSGSMIAVRRFSLLPDALSAHDRGPELRWDDVAAMIRVASRTDVERTTLERDVQDTGRGGSVSVERKLTRHERDLEQSLFIFAHESSAGALPWVLHARDARYLALGSSLRPTVYENFLATVAIVRARCPNAIYDERFAIHPLTRLDAVQMRRGERESERSSDAGIDLPVHLLARWLLEASNDPYRDARVGRDPRARDSRDPSGPPGSTQ